MDIVLLAFYHFFYLHPLAPSVLMTKGFYCEITLKNRSGHFSLRLVSVQPALQNDSLIGKMKNKLRGMKIL